MIHASVSPLRSPLAVVVWLAAWPAAAFAQAPETAPLVLTLPPSARVAALGGAWVAGTDRDVIFTNPAQLIGARSDFSVSLMHLGPEANAVALTSAYAAGRLSFTLGWGVELVNFRAGAGEASPFSPDVLLTRGVDDAQSALVTVGGAIVYKGYRIGAAGKYAADRLGVDRHAMLLDVGVGHTLFGGLAAAAVQNLGPHDLEGTPLAPIPRQVALGWSRPQQAGPLDLALFTQVLIRSGFTSPAAGLEASYSWIEGYSVALRAGARRPESTTEQSVAIGAAFTADRVTVDYAVQFFDTGNRAHLVTLRWR